MIIFHFQLFIPWRQLFGAGEFPDCQSAPFLTGKFSDVHSSGRFAERCVMLMSTYEEFMVILTVALLIVAILNLKNK